METTSTTSPARIAANRLNAQKSTGPRTPEGKAIVSRNAIKHSALARHLVVPDPVNAGETSAEFQAICDNCYAEFQPVGYLEEILVEQIIAGLWRTRRARQAEIAEIALNQKAIAKNNPKGAAKVTGDSDHVPRILKLASLYPDLDALELLVVKNEGCEYVLHVLNEGRQMFQRDKSITPKMCDIIVRLFGGAAKSLTVPLQQMTEANTHSGKPDARALLEKHQRDVMAFFDDKISYYEQLMAGRQSQTDADAQIRHDAAVLPEAKILYKILRYETAQERQILRAVDRLKKIQANRRPSASCGFEERETFLSANPAKLVNPLH